MHIICPHCTTSYAIDLATLGATGRTVRCSRCKEVWLARPEDATEVAALAPAMAEAGGPSGPLDAAAEWDALAREEEGQETPVVDSPSISGDWEASDTGETESPEFTGFAAAANRTNWLCFGYGFRFVNGRLVASVQRHCGDRLHAHHLPPLYNVLCH